MKIYDATLFTWKITSNDNMNVRDSVLTTR